MVLLFVPGLVPSAAAQGPNIDPDEAAQKLLSDDPAEVVEGRRDLLTYIDGGSLASLQRNDLGDRLVPILGQVIEERPDHSAVNAVLVAGALATNSSMTLVTDAFDDERPAVRLASMTAAEWVFDQIESHPPAAFPDRAGDFLESIGEAMRGEQDPYVLEGGVRALRAAWEVRRGDDFTRALRDPALTTLAESIRDRLASSPEEPPSIEMLGLVAKVANRLQSTIAEDVVNNAFGAEAVRVASREFATSVLDYLAARVQAGDLSNGPPERRARRREAMVQVVGSTENLVLISYQRLTGRSLEAVGAASELRASDQIASDLQWAEDLRRDFTGRDGILSRPPFIR